MYISPVVKGLATYIPGVSRLAQRHAGGTYSARYCYSVWLRHLVMAHANGTTTEPKVVAELGPGDSLGIGLAALISGTDRYYALDVKEYGINQRNLAIFDELVQLFSDQEDIPDETEFPRIKPFLKSYRFPDHVFSRERLDGALDPERLQPLRASVSDVGVGDRAEGSVSYIVPWDDAGVIRPASIDMVISQAVLEHVNDLSGTYSALNAWLRPGALMSHQIDFKSHGKAREWNGHWKYSDLTWKLIVGKRPFLLNRHPHSVHICLLEKIGFDVLCDATVTSPTRFSRSQLAARFKDMPEDDLTISGAFIQAVTKA